MKNLPKLPRGQGTMSYVNNNGIDYIMYQRFIGTKRRKRARVYGQSVEECLALMKEKEIEYDKFEVNTSDFSADFSNRAILQESMEVWLYEIKRTELSKDKSFDTIESTFNTHIKDTFLGKTFISNVNSLTIKKYINELLEKKSVSTTKKVYSLLNQFFTYYYLSDSNKNPMNGVKMPVTKKKVTINNISDDIFDENVTVLSDEEIDKLTEELSKPPSIGRIGYKHGYAILFLMWSFMRVGEALALQWKDINFEDKTVKIYKTYSKIKERNKKGISTGKYIWVITPPKSKKSIRKEYLDDKAIEMILKYKDIIGEGADDDFIIKSNNNTPLSIQYLNEILKKALKRAKITTQISIHGLRHTGISYFIRHGVATEVISELAGHSEITTTNRIYYNIIEEQKKNAYKDIK